MTKGNRSFRKSFQRAAARLLALVFLLSLAGCGGPVRESSVPEETAQSGETALSGSETASFGTASSEETRQESPKPTGNEDAESSAQRTEPVTGTQTPQPTETEAPQPTETEAPQPTETEAPKPTETEAPKPTETQAPRPTETEAPRPTETEAPQPTETEAPRPTETEAPQPTETETAQPEETQAPQPEETTPQTTEAETEQPKIYSEIESARSFVNHMTVGWNLGLSFAYYNASEGANRYSVSQYETLWGRKIFTQSMIDSVAAQGFNTVRIQISWLNHIDSEGNIDPAWMNRIEEVVSYCMNAGLYCIINTTGAGWLTAERASYDRNIVIYHRLWEQIAGRFRDYGHLLLFESCNEVLYQGMWWNPPAEAYSVMADLYQMFVNTVRAEGGYNMTRNLILNTYAASYDASMNRNFVLPQDPARGSHLLVEVHCYEPNNFCFNEINLGSTNFVNEWGTAQEKARLDEIMRGIGNRFNQELGVPVIIGEFGTVSRVSEEERAEYVKYYVQAATANRVKCVVFDDAWDFALYDRLSGTWPYPKIMKALFQGAGLIPDDPPPETPPAETDPVPPETDPVPPETDPVPPETDPLPPPPTFEDDPVSAADISGCWSARLFTNGPIWITSGWEPFDAQTRGTEISWDLSGRTVTNLKIEPNFDASLAGSVFTFRVTKVAYTAADGTVTKLAEAATYTFMAGDPPEVEILPAGQTLTGGTVTVRFFIVGKETPVPPDPGPVFEDDPVSTADISGCWSARLFTNGPAWITSEWVLFDGQTRGIEISWDLSGRTVTNIKIEPNFDPSLNGKVFKLRVTRLSYTDAEGQVIKLAEAATYSFRAGDPPEIEILAAGQTFSGGTITARIFIIEKTDS